MKMNLLTQRWESARKFMAQFRQFTGDPNAGDCELFFNAGWDEAFRSEYMKGLITMVKGGCWCELSLRARKTKCTNCEAIEYLSDAVNLEADNPKGGASSE